MRKKSSARPLRPGYRSSIPARARARITHQHASRAPERIEYLVGRSVVGCRHFDANGGLLFDYGIRRGRRHGREYRWDEPGTLVSATAYRNGLEHGLARQWSPYGRIIGTYRMRNGTGIDLWWQETWTKPRRPYLSEVRCMKNGPRAARTIANRNVMHRCRSINLRTACRNGTGTLSSAASCG